MSCMPQRKSSSRIRADSIINAKGRFAKNKDDGMTLEHFDSVIWLGDMNYRVAATNSEVVNELIQNDMWEVLKANDQLDIEKKLKRVAVGYNEGSINFAPTFKFERGTDLYNKKRESSWTDRILFRSNNGLLKQVNYDSNNLLKLSDHRPVFA